MTCFAIGLAEAEAEQGEELGDIDDGDAVGAGAGNESQLSIRGDGHIGGIGERQVRLIEEDLINAAVLPGQTDSVGDRPALQQAGHGHQVLGAVEGKDRKLARRVPGDALQEVGAGRDGSILHGRGLGIDDGDLGFGGRAKANELRKVVGHADPRAIRR